MICFLVPVKSKKLSSDWDKFSELVKRSLKSINGQKDRDFQIVVACHELPTKKFEHPQVHYVQVDFDVPQLSNEDWEKDRQLKESDKANKIQFAYEYAIANFNVDYFMVVDSDDCIQNGISKYVNSRLKENIPGWYVNKGYFYTEGSKFAFMIRSNFNVRCGTCIIIKKELFPQIIQKEPYLYYFHETIKLENNLSLVPYPKPAALYSMANGENHYMSKSKVSNLVNQSKYFSLAYFQSIYSKLTRYRPRFIGNGFKKSFNFYNIN